MKIALIGGRRKRSGIGPFIGNSFHRAGAAVVAVLGTTDATAREAAAALTQYGINAAAHTDFNRMLRAAQPDAVAIASPAATHLDYLRESVEAGVHVFCEKPFIWDAPGDVTGTLTRIFSAAERRKATVAMNSQWPFSLPFYEALCGPLRSKIVSSFYMRLSPQCSGREMIVEAVPHALSLLYCVCGEGAVSNLTATARADEMTIHFDYTGDGPGCAAEIRLTRQYTQPRDFSFGFNGHIVNRRLELKRYDIYFNYADRSCKIEDPLDLSVKDFISSIREGKAPLIGKAHIIDTTLLLRQIYRCCESAG
jgi:predicted dehydrogenase